MLRRVVGLVALALVMAGTAKAAEGLAKVEKVYTHEKGGLVVVFDRWIVGPPPAVVEFMDSVKRVEGAKLLYQTSYGGHSVLFTTADPPSRMTTIERTIEIGPCLEYRIDFDSTIVGKQPHESLLCQLVEKLYSGQVEILKRTEQLKSVTLRLQLHGPNWDRKPENDAPAPAAK